LCRPNSLFTNQINSIKALYKSKCKLQITIINNSAFTSLESVVISGKLPFNISTKTQLHNKINTKHYMELLLFLPDVHTAWNVINEKM